jgi:hypothetical protein
MKEQSRRWTGVVFPSENLAGKAATLRYPACLESHAG